jgi:hypothetical protein
VAAVKLTLAREDGIELSFGNHALDETGTAAGDFLHITGSDIAQRERREGRPDSGFPICMCAVAGADFADGPIDHSDISGSWLLVTRRRKPRAARGMFHFAPIRGNATKEFVRFSFSGDGLVRLFSAFDRFRRLHAITLP